MKRVFYNISERYTEDPLAPQSSPFVQLHMHDEYEIMLFLKGDSKYILENNIYSLEPGDMMITRKHELHRVFHNNHTPYHRFIFFVAPAFFQANNCPEYENQFLRSSENIGSKIPADLVRSSGLYDAFFEYKKFSENFTLDKNALILKYSVIKILHLINHISTFSAPNSANSTIQLIIIYLNNHFMEDITLDFLADKFFISKHYLCKAFRKATGLTVQEYIRLKRLSHVRELRSAGYSLTEAAYKTGFTNYSSFYRAYTKQYGITPIKDQF